MRAKFDRSFGDTSLRLSFDSFRTYLTGSGDGDNMSPSWSDQYNFNYETVHADLLACKMVKFMVYNGNGYIGEARCDLLTIAAGCADCALSIYETDTAAIGKLFVNISMEEVAETALQLKELVITFLEQYRSKGPGDLADARLYLETRADIPGVRKTRGPFQLDRMWARWSELDPCYFGSTAVSILGNSGVRIRMVESTCCGEIEIGYGVLNTSEFPTDHLLTGVRFDNVRFYEQDGGTAIGLMAGTVVCRHMPKFSQMFQGQNVDGVVHEGLALPNARIFPPRMVNCKMSAS